MSPASEWAVSRIRRFAWMLAGVTVLLVGTEVVALAGIEPDLRPMSLHQVSSNLLFAIGFGSPLVLHLSSLPGWREVGRTLALGLGLSLLFLSAWLANRTAHVTDADKELIAARVIIGLGLASAVVLGVRAGREPGRTEALIYLLPALVALVFTLEAGLYMNFTAAHFPATCDALACAADGAWNGFQPSFATGRLFNAQPWIAWVCAALYFAPSPTLVFVYTLQVRAKRPPPVDVVTVLLVLVVVGYAFYFLFPVCGPKATFGALFPDSPPPVDAVLAGPVRLADPAGWRNGMPSLHFGSVLLGYWHARPFGRWARLVAGVFVVGTILATMGLGEHYMVDLAVALPFTLMIQGFCTPARPEWRRARRTAIIGSAMLLVIWYALLWNVTASDLMPFLIRITFYVTGVAVGFWERRLYRTTAVGQP
jgi:hypothetical protein